MRFATRWQYKALAHGEFEPGVLFVVGHGSAPLTCLFVNEDDRNQVLVLADPQRGISQLHPPYLLADHALRLTGALAPQGKIIVALGEPDIRGNASHGSIVSSGGDLLIRVNSGNLNVNYINLATGLEGRAGENRVWHPSWRILWVEGEEERVLASRQAEPVAT
jgi:hypothetical protein